jgi:hypothetical protein
VSASDGGDGPRPPYDPAAAAAQAQALCARANSGFVAPILKLIARQRMAASLGLGATAAAAIAAPASAVLAASEPALAFAVLSPVAVLMSLASGVFVFARWDARARDRAEHNRWRAYDHDLGSERDKAAEQFRTLDRATGERGAQDYAGRALALQALNRRLDVEHHELRIDTARFYGLMIPMVCGAVACGVTAWVAAVSGAGFIPASLAGLGMLAAATLLALAVLVFGRRHTAALVAFLAPPHDDADAFVAVFDWLFVLMGQVTAQNNYLRR